jgi:hypothetical protein
VATQAGTVFGADLRGKEPGQEMAIWSSSGCDECGRCTAESPL